MRFILRWRKLLLPVIAALLLCGCAAVSYRPQTLAQASDGAVLWASLPPTPSPASTPIPSQAPVAKGTGTVTGVDQFAYVRSGPGETYDVAMKLDAGTRVSVMELLPSGDWYTLLIDGEEVYIHKDYFTVDTGATATPSPTSIPVASSDNGLIQSRMGTVANCEESVNTRSGPGYSYAEAVTLDKGARVKVLGTYINDEWHKIEVGGYPAYIHKDYLDIDED